MLGLIGLNAAPMAELAAALAVALRERELGRKLSNEERSKIWFDAWESAFDKQMKADGEAAAEMSRANRQEWRSELRWRLGAAGVCLAVGIVAALIDFFT